MITVKVSTTLLKFGEILHGFQRTLRTEQPLNVDVTVKARDSAMSFQRTSVIIGDSVRSNTESNGIAN